MALLLYKSDEMFSSTELIRKSKMIFDKIVDKEIEKAIILRDGKPGFLLMDFKKYEKIMAEYERLKQKESSSNKSLKKIKVLEEKKEEPKKQKVQKEDDDLGFEMNLQVIEEEPIKATEQFEQIPKITEETEEINNEVFSIEDNKTEEKILEKEDFKVEIKQEEPVEKKELNEEEEVNNALETISNISLSDEEREKVEARIKERIKKAREERARLAQEEERFEKEDLKEELEVQVQLREKNDKKARELKEFWD